MKLLYNVNITWSFWASGLCSTQYTRLKLCLNIMVKPLGLRLNRIPLKTVKIQASCKLEPCTLELKFKFKFHNFTDTRHATQRELGYELWFITCANYTNFTFANKVNRNILVSNFLLFTLKPIIGWQPNYLLRYNFIEQSLFIDLWRHSGTVFAILVTSTKIIRLELARNFNPLHFPRRQVGERTF